MPKRTLLLSLLLSAAAASAQSRILASVPVADATATGSLSISGNKNLLGNASVITALNRPAHVSLFRGGDMLVCQTSVTHLTGGRESQQKSGRHDALLISLDRGAMELHMDLTRDDALITPDLRFTSAETRDKPFPLNLALRVTPNGDTCVENRGKKAPSLTITDAFGQDQYQLKAGQHVLFEHGSLKEVVDTETSPCGCPPPESMSLAEAAVRGGSKTKQDTTQFPAAVSQGLAAPAPVPGDKPGDTKVQLSATLTYDPNDPGADAPAPPTGVSVAPSTPARQTPTPAAESKTSPVHSVGRFFKKIFAR